MRKVRVALTLAVAACSSPSLPRVPQGARVLEVRGAVKNGPFLLGRQDLRSLPRRTLHGAPPGSGKTSTWSGVPVALLVSDRVEPRRGADTVIAWTAAGSAIPIPLVTIRQLQPVLADTVDETPLAAPAIAWPSLEAPGLATDPRAGGWWATDVVAFEIVQWQRTYGRALAVPDGAQDGARRGSAVFAERCVSCHRLRDVGGRNGPDLTTAISRMRAASFYRLLRSHHGALPPDGERDGGDVSWDLWSFLGAVATGSTALPEEPGSAPADEDAADKRAPGRR